MSFHIQTKTYSGPFDLLLSLVTRQKLDISSISVSELAQQYLTQLKNMGELDLDVASDFALVAATLLDIKAASLIPDVPQNNLDDTDEDLKDLTPEDALQVLAARLIVYKQFRNAAAALAARGEAESRMFAREAGPDPEFWDLAPDYLVGITLRSLAVICADLDSRHETFLLEAEHVAPKRIPLALTIAAIERQLKAKGSAKFSDLIEGERLPSAVVAAFLAVLELSAAGAATLDQKTAFGEIEVTHVAKE